MKNFLTSFFAFLALALFAGPNPIVAQPASQTGLTFHFAAWPYQNSIMAVGSQVHEELQNAWFDHHLPRFTQMRLQLIHGQDHSLTGYQHWINQGAECIETEYTYLEQEINQDQTLYRPILFAYPREEKPPAPVETALIRYKGNDNWPEPLGIVSPHLELAGGAQLRYWTQQTGAQPDVYRFDSPDEVLRHLLVGTIRSAAVPAGWFGGFLERIERPSLARFFEIEPVPAIKPQIVICLRNDLYQQAFFRTLIGETWLRNQFPNRFHYAPASAMPERQAQTSAAPALQP
mgnify:CR=1 FL=1